MNVLQYVRALNVLNFSQLFYFLSPCYWPQFREAKRPEPSSKTGPHQLILIHPASGMCTATIDRRTDREEAVFSFKQWEGRIFIQTVRRQDFYSDKWRGRVLIQTVRRQDCQSDCQEAGGIFIQTVRSQDFQSDSEEAGFSVRQWGGRIFIQIMRRQPFFQSVRRQDFHSDREEAGFSVNSEGRIFIQKMKRKEVHLAGYMIFFDTPTIGRTTLRRTTLGQTTIRWTTHSRTTT